jgi:hypothetical protein
MKTFTLTHISRIAQYLFELRLKYGVLTSYNQTILLRKVDIGRACGLEYSPVIHHRDRGSISGQTVSFCQSFYHVGVLGSLCEESVSGSFCRAQACVPLLKRDTISFIILSHDTRLPQRVRRRRLGGSACHHMRQHIWISFLDGELTYFLGQHAPDERRSFQHGI